MDPSIGPSSALFKIPATISVSVLLLKGLKQKRNGNFSTTTTFLFLFFKHDCWKGEFLLISVAFDVPTLDPCFNELQKFAFLKLFLVWLCLQSCIFFLLHHWLFRQCSFDLVLFPKFGNAAIFILKEKSTAEIRARCQIIWSSTTKLRPLSSCT